MDEGKKSDPTSGKSRTRVERRSDRETLVTRTVDAPARLVFEAFTRPELFRQWWIPKSMGMTLVSCDMDVRTGGGYRLVIKHPAASDPMAFYGKYVEVTPCSRLVWSNDENGDAGSVTTVTFDERNGETRVTVHELYASKEALEAASGAADAMPEQFEQLDALLVTLAASAGRS